MICSGVIDMQRLLSHFELLDDASFHINSVVSEATRLYMIDILEVISPVTQVLTVVGFPCHRAQNPQ